MNRYEALKLVEHLYENKTYSLVGIDLAGIVETTHVSSNDRMLIGVLLDFKRRISRENFEYAHSMLEASEHDGHAEKCRTEASESRGRVLAYEKAFDTMLTHWSE